jgi:hypothetical protein
MSDQIRNLVKGELIKLYGTQWRAAQELAIRESRLSLIINGRVKPNENERTTLRRVLGEKVVDEMPA